MLNVCNTNTLVFLLLIQQQSNSKFFYKFSKNQINLYSFIINPLPLITYQVIDFSQILKNIFIILQNKYSFYKKSIFFFFKNIFYSNTIQKYILDWYERELYEKKNNYCFNIFDKRNLLYNYDFRYSYSKTYKNSYFWAFTNIQSQIINFNNNLRIIL